MTCTCGCCTGPVTSTPACLENPSGLSRLHHRVGTHAQFVASMRARLSGRDFPKLSELRTRDASDASMALIDAWATVADVLTFYQERIANEGYLRTATEMRSVFELARLVGYAPRPGVAASVYLAFTIEKDSRPVVIPKGLPARSVPEPGEEMQTFETSAELEARAQWNDLQPRKSRPQTIQRFDGFVLWIRGTTPGLAENDPVLVHTDGATPAFRRIRTIWKDAENDRTRITLREKDGVLAESVNKILEAYPENDPRRQLEDSEGNELGEVLEKIRGAAGGGTPGFVKAVDDNLPVLGSIFRFNRPRESANAIADSTAELRDLADLLRDPAAASSPKEGEGAPQLLPEGILDGLSIPPSLPPANALALGRSTTASLKAGSDAIPRLQAALVPDLGRKLYTAIGALSGSGRPDLRVFALRVSAAPFGHNAPLRSVKKAVNGEETDDFEFQEWRIEDPWGNSDAKAPRQAADHIYLDNDYGLTDDTWVVIDRPPREEGAEGKTDLSRLLLVLKPLGVVSSSLAAYGMSGKVSLVQIREAAAKGSKDDWLFPREPYSVVRRTRVYTRSEQLVLVEVPIGTDVSGDSVELETTIADLEPGRWLVVAGERTDVLDERGRPVRGLLAAELVMLAGVEQQAESNAADLTASMSRLHTTLLLATPLAYRYRRDTVAIHGNVVEATHGETRKETLGSGDASKVFQSFPIKKPPLTYVPAPTTSGVRSTMEVRVDDLKRESAEDFADLGAIDRQYVTRADRDGGVSVVFGDGVHGARLPTGVANVDAVYRSGIGKGGNVAVGQISLLAARPLGVKEVVNPLRSSGGADPETRDQARRNAPLAVLALDRLVSSKDYADFTRLFAGIGKADAERLSDGRREVVFVTIAGIGDGPIDPTSALLANLRKSLVKFGDPSIPVEVDLRERFALVLSAKVKPRSDVAWERLEPKIRAALLEAFGFEASDLGRDLLLSHVVRVIQSVRGVECSDVDVFTKVGEAEIRSGFGSVPASGWPLESRIGVEPAHRDKTSGALLPAQLVCFSPEVPETLILQEKTA